MMTTPMTNYFPSLLSLQIAVGLCAIAAAPVGRCAALGGG